MNRILQYLDRPSLPRPSLTEFDASARDVLRSRAQIRVVDVYRFVAGFNDALGLWQIELWLTCHDQHVWGCEDQGVCLEMFRRSMPVIYELGRGLRS